MLRMAIVSHELVFEQERVTATSSRPAKRRVEMSEPIEPEKPAPSGILPIQPFFTRASFIFFPCHEHQLRYYHIYSNITTFLELQ